ncbi:MAG: hypothetical protein HY089_09265 [Ignavibacteriales bacterium]|nr:hypothetical protein [Ignavibacteriales bacterium]
MNKLFVMLILCIMCVMALDACNDMGSEPVANLQPPPPPAQEVSFQNNIKPIFQNYGCNGCHGGSGGLFVQTVAQLLKGGDHGPVIVAGKADSSNITKKLSSTPPFGDRMPQGGPYLPDSTLQTIRTWINQGAKNN